MLLALKLKKLNYFKLLTLDNFLKIAANLIQLLLFSFFLILIIISLSFLII